MVRELHLFYKMLYENEEIKKKQVILLKKKENYNEKYKSIIGVSQAMANVFDTLELIKNIESPKSNFLSSHLISSIHSLQINDIILNNYQKD